MIILGRGFDFHHLHYYNNPPLGGFIVSGDGE